MRVGWAHRHRSIRICQCVVWDVTATSTSTAYIDILIQPVRCHFPLEDHLVTAEYLSQHDHLTSAHLTRHYLPHAFPFALQQCRPTRSPFFQPPNLPHHPPSSALSVSHSSLPIIRPSRSVQEEPERKSQMVSCLQMVLKAATNDSHP